MPMLSRSCGGVMPQRSTQPLTSLSVSHRCMKQGSLYFSAREAMYFMRSMPVVYSAWMPSR